jgi:hypothetical protein
MIMDSNTNVEALSIRAGGAYNHSTQQNFLPIAKWKRLLLAAKAAYNKGYKSDGLRLYKEGLIQADQSLFHNRTELIEFLEENIWCSLV